MRPRSGARPCSWSRAIALLAVILFVALASHRARPPLTVRPPSASKAWLSAAVSSASIFPRGETPLLVPVELGAGSAALLAQSLRSLRKIDRAATTPLVFCSFAFGGSDPDGVASRAVAALVAAIDWAPTLMLPPPPPPAKALGRGGALSAAGLVAWSLASFAFAHGARGAVLLTAGLEVSQDFRDWSDFVLRELDDATVQKYVFAVNAFYEYGQGFGGEERWTLATDYPLDASRGVVLPLHSWPAVSSAAQWAHAGDGGTSWAAALGRTATALGRVALTPRISRVRFTGTDARSLPREGSDFLALSGGDRNRLADMYIPDHPLDYAPHRFIIVNRHD